MAVAKAKRGSDLPVRAASALAMVGVAGIAFWLGGLWWAAFVALVGVGVIWEWFGLVGGFQHSPMGRGLWNGAGIVYVVLAMLILVAWRWSATGAGELLTLMVAVIATDVFAYFLGRTIGGPKIAPAISPSKTWAGLVGGMIGAACTMLAVAYHQYYGDYTLVRLDPGAAADPAAPGFQWLPAILAGAAIAIVAQAGDFFESWMKRRAGVKDSGRLLPGHGGLLDRVDGLLAVLLVSGALFVGGRML